MFKSVLTLLLLNFSLLFADNVVLPKNQILFTDQGIFFQIDGNLKEADGAEYVGNGMYNVSEQAFCKRCGWTLDEDGRCTNQNCEQYGPRRE